MVIGLGIFGSLIGSFLNVVIYRVPLGKSIVSPPSACGSCGHEIRAYDNVPVLSWLWLRGKCRDCGAPISIRYPLIELGTAAFFAIVAVVFVPALFTAATPVAGAAAALALVAFLYLAAISIALVAIDLDVMRLPNAIVLPAYGVGAVLLGAASLLTGAGDAAFRALVGAAALFVIYFVLALLGGMGFGDVKLAGVLGLYLGWLGWEQLIVGWIAGFIVGGLWGVSLLIARRVGRGARIPFGPWLIAGAWIGILFGHPIAGAYLSTLHLT